MLRVFRLDTAGRTCRWLKPDEIADRIDDLGTTTDILWIDLEAPTLEEEALVFDRMAHVHTLTREDVTRERRDPDHVPHLPKVEQFPTTCSSSSTRCTRS
jgi:hypothetical protein